MAALKKRQTIEGVEVVLEHTKIGGEVPHYSVKLTDGSFVGSITYMRTARWWKGGSYSIKTQGRMIKVCEDTAQAAIESLVKQFAELRKEAVQA